jgi:NAD(P)-dependent dehydrogenase (short-subunit alcohol dehydrogenase family)/acyl carrier protein
MAAALGKDETPQPSAEAATLAVTGEKEPRAAAPATSAPAGDPASPASPTDTTDRDHVRQEVVRIVGERTGYPPDMLDVNADLEADLGIDSIKRVEIAGRLRKAFPHIGATADTSKVGNLSTLRTLSALIERIASAPADGTLVSGDGSAPDKKKLPETACPCSGADVPVPRFMMRLEETAALQEPGGIRQDGVFLVTDDEKGVADAVAEAIVGLGGHAVIVSAQEKRKKGRQKAVPRYQADFPKPESLHRLVADIRKTEGRIAGIVHLLPLRHRSSAEADSLAGWRRRIQEEVKSLFFLSQAAAEDLKVPAPTGRGRILAVIEADRLFPGHGGITGMINTLATEWPELVGRTLALDSAEPMVTLAKRILAELQDDRPVRFVRYQDGACQTVRIEPAELGRPAAAPMQIGSEDVILLTGGACGITAQVAIELAERFKPTLVLTGRSPQPETAESPLTRGVESPAELRRLLAGALAGPGGKAALSNVEAAYRRLCREREIRATLAALLTAGARVTYLQADVRDGEAFGQVLARVYAEFGRLDGVVYGAGTIEDKRIEEKTPESFDRVFDTKADGAFVLVQRLRLDSVKFVVFFSSVAYLGNAGQSDYAAANGVLNTLARDLDRRTPGRVVSVLWGPWQSAGMASEEVQRRFKEQGVQIIPPPAGRRCLVEELLHGRKGDVEVILGNAPYGPAVTTPGTRRGSLPLIGGSDSVILDNNGVEAACLLDPSAHAYLRDHMLDGKPVFPAAMAMELMAEAAWAAEPGSAGGIEITGLEVQNGIVLEDGEPLTLRVAGQRAASPANAGGKAVALAMRITSPEKANRAHYRASVTLGNQPVPPRLEASAFAGLKPFPLSVSDAYRQWLFQGPCFTGISSIEGIRSDAIAGMLQSVAPAVCLTGAPRGHWLLDPTVVDASLQLVILWERHWHDMTPLPMQIARFRLFESLSDQPVRCLVKATVSDGGESLMADIFYTDATGRLLAVMEELRCVCTKALNRLSGHAEPRSDADPEGKRRQETTR